MRVGDRCRVVKVAGWWLVVHDPSELVVWAKFGPVWEDAIVYATRGKK